MNKQRVLILIVISQFFCTSLWFAGNGVMVDLITEYQLSEKALGHITSALQFGFIAGTLVYALLTLADRFSPSKVFFVSAMVAALFNLGTIIGTGGLAMLLTMRFMTGFFLAGIYPVGMKIAADYFDNRLGKALGYLLGALVLGTAFPHLLKDFTGSLSWRIVLMVTSGMSVLGGLLILIFVRDGPHKKQSQQMDLTAFLDVFRDINFRSAAFGYFGHMWELYTFWAFVPVILVTYTQMNAPVVLNVSLLSFIVIGAGGLACIIGGYIAMYAGSKKVAFYALLLSGMCCLLSPLLFKLPVPAMILFLVFWGLVVIADSPQFSTLVARYAPAEKRGTALTIVNCIGFSITIVSIQLITLMSDSMETAFIYLLLAPGPIFGLLAMQQSSN